MTHSEAHLREATRDDIAGMHRVRVLVRENRLSDPARITTEDYRAAIEELGRGWVSVVDEQIVGFAIAYRNGEIWALFVDPQHEGYGHGKRLHTNMIAWLGTLGLPHAYLGTAAGTRAHQFYLRLGWQESGMKIGSDEINLTWRFRDLS